MSNRGRGCLEVRPSSNPFFQTSSRDIGIKPETEITWKVNGEVPKFSPSTHTVDGNFAFLYTRESDLIGGKIPKPASDQKRLMTKTEFLKSKREQYHSTHPLEETQENIQNESPKKATAEDILRVYKHAPKYEDPRFSTSTNEFGKKAPSVATIVVERAARPQGFSNSFQNIKPKNTSLTTALTRSTVHSTLDPQFA